MTCEGTETLSVAVTGLWSAIDGSWKAPGRAGAPEGELTDQLCQAELLADGAQLLAFEAVPVGVHQHFRW